MIITRGAIVELVTDDGRRAVAEVDEFMAGIVPPRAALHGADRLQRAFVSLATTLLREIGTLLLQLR